MFRKSECGCVYLVHSEELLWLLAPCDGNDTELRMRPGLRRDHTFESLELVTNRAYLEHVSRDMADLICEGYRLRQIKSALG